MTTDKDREWTLCFVETLKANGVNMSDFTLEIIDELMKEHRAESAEQARKETADRAVEWVMKKLVPGVLADIIVQDLLYSILFDSGKNDDHIPDVGKKLAIAVKALENIIDGNDLACERGESMTSWMDSDFRRQAKDALKEIQG